MSISMAKASQTAAILRKYPVTTRRKGSLLLRTWWGALEGRAEARVARGRLSEAAARPTNGAAAGLHFNA